VSIRNTLPFATVPEWLLFEADVSDRAVRLYAVLVRHADKAGHAHPSRRRLAKLLGCSESSLDRAMKELEASHAVQVHRHRNDDGDWDVNQYVLTPGGVTTEATPTLTTDATGGVTHDDMNESQSEREPFEREKDRGIGKKILDKALEIANETEFEFFWNTYPRRQGKGAAKKAFQLALTRTSFEAITLGAERYRDDPNRDPSYTALPATWLNQDRWEDDSLPPRHSGRPVVDKALEIAMGVNGDRGRSYAPRRDAPGRLPAH
jgi:helix-turn-helix protein